MDVGESPINESLEMCSALRFPGTQSLCENPVATIEVNGKPVPVTRMIDGGNKAKSQLPGFMLAVALVEKEVADMRAQMAGAVYRCAAKAGHDVANVRSIFTTIGKDGTPIIQIEAADLVDVAEQG